MNAITNSPDANAGYEYTDEDCVRDTQPFWRFAEIQYEKNGKEVVKERENWYEKILDRVRAEKLDALLEEKRREEIRKQEKTTLPLILMLPFGCPSHGCLIHITTYQILMIGMTRRTHQSIMVEYNA